MENLLEKLLEMEKEQQVDSAASGVQPRRGDEGGAHGANTFTPRSEGAGKGKLLQQQTLSHRHRHPNRQVKLCYTANCRLLQWC